MPPIIKPHIKKIEFVDNRLSIKFPSQPNNKKEAAIWKPIDENLSQLDFCSFIESCNFFSR